MRINPYLIAGAAAWLLFGATPLFSQPGGSAPVSRLARGIELYKAGRHDDALIELRAVVGIRPHTPLAYYYAAAIRYGKEQYPQARKNLLAALEDSSDFHDAVGLLACTDLKIGNETDALVEWRQFIGAVGISNPGEKITAASIVLPEDYRARRSGVPVGAGVDSTATRALTGIGGKPGVPDTSAAAGAAALDLNRRIESQIRTGYYTIFGAAALLVGGITAVVIWMRRRKRMGAGFAFETEMQRLAATIPETDDFDLATEEEESAPPPELHVHQAVPAREEDFREREVAPREKTIPLTAPRPFSDAVSLDDNPRRPITEEIKALVARMHHEGHDPVDIARTADLTRTEVDLIVAVRTKKTDRLVESAVENDGYPEGDTLHQAIRELSSEGNDVHAVARRLGISTSEVKLALAVMEKKHGR